MNRDMLANGCRTPVFVTFKSPTQNLRVTNFPHGQSRTRCRDTLISPLVREKPKKKLGYDLGLHLDIEWADYNE